MAVDSAQRLSCDRKRRCVRRWRCRVRRVWHGDEAARERGAFQAMRATVIQEKNAGFQALLV